MRAARWGLCLLFVLAVTSALVALAGAEVVQKGGTRVKFEGGLDPKALPRNRSVPVRVEVGAKITALNDSNPPRLRRISIAINSAGSFDPGVVPVCTMRDIQPSTTRDALRACGSSLVGTGRFAARVLLPQQAPFPGGGELYAFNGRYRGKPAILAHVYGTEPVPTSFTLPFVIGTRKGELGTVLTASLAAATGKAGYITELALDLKGSSGGGRTPYLRASCPAPKGFSSATFAFARASLNFGGKKTLSQTLVRTCKARG